MTGLFGLLYVWTVRGFRWDGWFASTWLPVPAHRLPPRVFCAMEVDLACPRTYIVVYHGLGFFHHSRWVQTPLPLPVY